MSYSFCVDLMPHGLSQIIPCQIVTSLNHNNAYIIDLDGNIQETTTYYAYPFITDITQYSSATFPRHCLYHNVSMDVKNNVRSLICPGTGNYIGFESYYYNNNPYSIPQDCSIIASQSWCNCDFFNVHNNEILNYSYDYLVLWNECSPINGGYNDYEHYVKHLLEYKQQKFESFFYHLTREQKKAYCILQLEGKHDIYNKYITSKW